MTLSRRGFLIVGGSAAAVTLVGNRAALAVVKPADRYDVAIRAAQDLIATDRGASAQLRALNVWRDAEYGKAALLSSADRAARSAEVLRIWSKDTDDARAAARSYYDSAEYTAWLKRADLFVERILTDFDEDPPHRVVRDLFDGHLQIDALDAEALRVCVPGITPIALVRQMVQREKVAFHMSRMSQFSVFAERYRKHVMY